MVQYARTHVYSVMCSPRKMSWMIYEQELVNMAQSEKEPMYQSLVSVAGLQA